MHGLEANPRTEEATFEPGYLERGMNTLQCFLVANLTVSLVHGKLSHTESFPLVVYAFSLLEAFTLLCCS
jgi:hypothetical protein